MYVRSKEMQVNGLNGGKTLPVEIRQENGWGMRFLRLDRLLRDTAVVGALLLVIVAVRNTSLPQAQSVFSALKTSAGIQWDESVGKLSFVSEFLPAEIRAVWNEQPSITVFKPVSGTISHAWSAGEPYITISGNAPDIRAAADGEVMSIAHGVDEERILRIRHEDGSETLYGNLAACNVNAGDIVSAGDVIATLMDHYPLAFELRVDGRSVDPSERMIPFLE